MEARDWHVWSMRHLLDAEEAQLPFAWQLSLSRQWRKVRECGGKKNDIFVFLFHTKAHKKAEVLTFVFDKRRRQTPKTHFPKKIYINKKLSSTSNAIPTILQNKSISFHIRRAIQNWHNPFTFLKFWSLLFISTRVIRSMKDAPEKDRGNAAIRKRTSENGTTYDTGVQKPSNEYVLVSDWV